MIQLVVLVELPLLEAALAFDNIPSWKAEDDAFWDLSLRKVPDVILEQIRNLL